MERKYLCREGGIRYKIYNEETSENHGMRRKDVYEIKKIYATK
jgi:hypothetical protein